MLLPLPLAVFGHGNTSTRLSSQTDQAAYQEIDDDGSGSVTLGPMGPRRFVRLGTLFGVGLNFTAVGMLCFSPVFWFCS